MTEMVTSGSMSGDGRRSDGPLGERGCESRRALQAPPALYATAPCFDSTDPTFDNNSAGRSRGLKVSRTTGQFTQACGKNTHCEQGRREPKVEVPSRVADPDLSSSFASKVERNPIQSSTLLRG